MLTCAHSDDPSHSFRYRNIEMVEIDGQCIQMTLNYGKAAPTNKSATPVFDGVVIENVHCGKGTVTYPHHYDSSL